MQAESGAKKKTVIVIDGDQKSRRSTVEILAAAGYQVEECGDARGALESMVLAEFVAVICDPYTAGVGLQALLRNVRRKNFPLIVTSDSAKDIAAINDAVVVMPKRPDSAVLIDALAVCAGEREAPDAEQLTGEGYFRVALADFLLGKKTGFDIFVRIGPLKYVKVANVGDELSPDRLMAYKNRGARFLYLRQDDFSRYLGLNVAMAKQLPDREAISIEKRIKMVAHASDVILEHLNANRIDGKLFQAARTVVESSVSMLSSSDSGFRLLEMLNSRSDAMYIHYVGVSFYSTLVARELSMTMPAEMYKISVGGLLHDIGATESDEPPTPGAMKSPVAAGAQRDKSTHPTRGAKLLGEISQMPEEVVRIILEHHEHPTGVGYPMGITEDEIHPFARLVGVVDEFCHLILKSAQGPGISPEDALNKMLQSRMYGASLRYFEVLVKLFKLQIDDRTGMVRPQSS